MNAFTALVMGILPLFLFVWVWTQIHNGTDEKQDTERWLLYLLGITTSLLAAMFGLILSSVNSTPPSIFIFMPSLWGAIAAICLYFFSGNRLWHHNHLNWAILAIILALLIGLWFAGDPSILLIVVFGGLLTALSWQAWVWVTRWKLAAFLVMILLVLLALWQTYTSQSLLKNPAWLASTVQIILALVPGVAIIVAARLIHAGFSYESTFKRRGAVLALTAATAILLLLGYQVMLASIWDVATDGLSGIFLVGLNSLAGIASALILAWKLTGTRKLAAFLFAVIVPVTMIGAERLGTFDREWKWGTLPGQVTQSRAEKIDLAIQRFHAKNSAYPQTLGELTPEYLLFIPIPYIIPGQDWCYESGEGYYRFGYVYREMFSLPASVRIHAEQGEPPDPAWECDQEADKYQDVPGF